jgi:hypothetical protein
MKLRNALASAAVLALGTFVLAPPVGAAETIATFTVLGGGLAVTVPISTIALQTGDVYTGTSTAVGQLGPVTVTDLRGNTPATWIAEFASTPFTTGTATAPNETVALPSISYASGPATSTGVGTFVPMATAAMSAAPAGRTVAWTAGAGVNSATWNPTLTFALLAAQSAGTYTGTITHSVV